MQLSSSKNSENAHRIQRVYHVLIPCLRDGVDRRPLSIAAVCNWLGDNAPRTRTADGRRALISGRLRRQCSTTRRHMLRNTVDPDDDDDEDGTLRYEQSNVDVHSYSSQSAMNVKDVALVSSISSSSSSSFGRTFPGTRPLRQRRLGRALADDIDGVRARSCAVRNFHTTRGNRLS